MTETKDQVIAKIAATIDFEAGKAGKSIFRALEKAFSAGFDRGWELCNESHAMSMEALEAALANRK